jgi:hypothetical protein
MNWIFHSIQEPEPKKTNREEPAGAERKEYYITLVLVALLVSVVITGLITPQLAQSLFF